MVETALVKTANTVTMVAQRCVMANAPTRLLERLASKRRKWFQLRFKTHEIRKQDAKTRQEKTRRFLFRWKRAPALVGNLKEGQLLDSHQLE